MWLKCVHMLDMTHSYVWHDSFICVTWCIDMCDVNGSYTWWNMTHSYVWHDLFIRVTWLIHMCDMTRSYVWHVSFTCVTWRIHMCDVACTRESHAYMWHDSSTCRDVTVRRNQKRCQKRKERLRQMQIQNTMLKNELSDSADTVFYL